MTSAFRKFLLITATIAVTAPGAQAEEFSAAQKKALEGIIKEYILENPETLVESLDLYQLRREQEREEQAAKVMGENMDLLTSKDSPSIGNPDGEIVVVEFFDYNCGYCKRALPDIQAVADKDKDVRIVFKEMPILGPSSMTAAQWAMAAHKQGKYFEFHAALMNHRGNKDANAMKSIARKLKLDVDKMAKDANSKEVKNMINEDMELARKIGISGTPAFIVDGKLYPGYLGEGGLQGSIENARKNSDKEDG